MPRLTPLLLLAILSLPVAAERDYKQFETEIDAGNLDSLRIDCHIGEVRVTPSADDRIYLHLQVYEKVGWFLSRGGSLEDVELEIEQGADQLRLQIDQEDFKEVWTLRVPARLDLAVDIGIGDVDVQDPGGDVSIDIGIGDARIRAGAAGYGYADADVGVGDAQVRYETGEAISERALVAATTRWRGDGAGRLEIDAGIGSATIELR